ncbi:DUF2059 domain-containing protein [Chryseobacterium shandongense]|uniref:DUF2059 domain-containing protein n=2 Tax=Chryseobacterium shandongense TaxID=1493872 RepID=A0AAD1DMC2_9FLAO|nr:DUF2059 domain-containing protein [Chryseobacterium shandongense]AZA95331.1 DUF2059 domain-containing protein [Chryseobacterium shandongense]
MKGNSWLIKIMIKKIIFVFTMFCFTFSYAQTKQEKIKELISLSGAFPISRGIPKEVIATYKKKYDNVPESEWTALEQKITIDALINNVIEIYASRFTESEVDELLVFYKSDLGRKMIRHSQDMIHEIQTATGNWAMKVTEIINNHLVKKGYLTSPPPPVSDGPLPPMMPKK